MKSLELVDKLNDLMYEKNDCRFEFSLTSYYEDITIKLHENYETGQAFSVYDSEGLIIEYIEDEFSKNLISQQEMILKSIKGNIKRHIKNLEEVLLELNNFKV